MSSKVTRHTPKLTEDAESRPVSVCCCLHQSAILVSDRGKEPVVEHIEGPAVNRQSTTPKTRSFLAAASAAWADIQNASRLMVEHQMGPKRPHHHS